MHTRGYFPMMAALESTNSLSVNENLNLAVVDSVVAPVTVLKKRTLTMKLQLSHRCSYKLG